jgi:hypothetical protein
VSCGPVLAKDLGVGRNTVEAVDGCKKTLRGFLGSILGPFKLLLPGAVSVYMGRMSHPSWGNESFWLEAWLVTLLCASF